MAKPHWFPFYVSDFLSSPAVTMMTAEEVGGYVLLLCYAWQDPHGSLPIDDDSLRVLSRVKGDLSRLKSCFREKKGRLFNGRLTQELEKAQAKSDSAKKSNAVRWQVRHLPVVQCQPVDAPCDGVARREQYRDNQRVPAHGAAGTCAELRQRALHARADA